MIQAGKESAAAREHDALVHDVGDQLRWRFLDGVLDRLDDERQGGFDGLADLLAADLDAAWQAGQQVTTPEGDALGVPLPGGRRADRDLDVFRGALAEEQVVLAASVGDDVDVHLIATDPDAAADHDAA